MHMHTHYTPPHTQGLTAGVLPSPERADDYNLGDVILSLPVIQKGAQSEGHSLEQRLPVSVHACVYCVYCVYCVCVCVVCRHVCMHVCMCVMFSRTNHALISMPSGGSLR